MKLRAEGRRLRKELEAASKPATAPDLEKLQKENGTLRKELEATNRQLAQACWPHDHENEKPPATDEELQKELEDLRKKWKDAKAAALRLREDTRHLYQMVIAEGRASKKSYVFKFGVAVGEFLDDWFG
jgi:hypothetical protein